MQFDLGVHCKWLLSMKGGSGELLENHFLGVKDGAIAEITPFHDSLAPVCSRFIDASDQILIPGLINGHTHLGMSLFRGFEDDLPFHDWLFKRIFPMEAELVDEEFVRTGAELSALECIRFGTTCVNDMYFFPKTTAHVLDQAGLRGLVAQPFIDFVMPDEKHLGDQAISSREARFEEFYKLYSKHTRIRPSLGPHAPYTGSDDLIRLMAKLSRDYQVRVHMHVCETEGEVEDSLQKYGKTPAKRLFDLGVLGPHFMAAHCVRLTDAEIELFKQTGTNVLYNPDSNMKLGSGVAPLLKFKEAGLAVGIGTDGAASNNDLSLFGAMDIGTKLQKVSHKKNTAMVALDALNMATLEGARALGMDHLVGSLEVGKRADFVCLRTDLPHVKPLHSVISQLVYAYQGMEVDTVVCEGRILLDRGKFTTLNEKKIYQKADHLQAKLKSQLENF